MDLSAATATSDGLEPQTILMLFIAGLVWLACYTFACWFWPFAACKKCDGQGRFKSPSGRAWRRCPRCKGTATRLRTGRRIFNWLHVTKEEAKK